MLDGTTNSRGRHWKIFQEIGFDWPATSIDRKRLELDLVFSVGHALKRLGAILLLIYIYCIFMYWYDHSLMTTCTCTYSTRSHDFFLKKKPINDFRHQQSPHFRYCEVNMVMLKRLQQLIVSMICLLLLLQYIAYYKLESALSHLSENLTVFAVDPKLPVAVEEDASFTTFFRQDDNVISVPSIPIDCSRLLVVMTELNAVSKVESIDRRCSEVEFYCHNVAGPSCPLLSVQYRVDSTL